MKEKHDHKSLTDLAAEQIMAYALSPTEHPLPEKYREQYDRVVSAAKLLDSYPNTSHVISLLHTKYRVSTNQLREDIRLAQELFKTKNTFDWDFWFAWMIKDQVELIQRCKTRGDLKAWNAAKKVLHEMIGEKPIAVEDPTRMMRNLFVVQINNIGGSREIPLEDMKNLSDEDKREVMDALYETVPEESAEAIFNS